MEEQTTKQNRKTSMGTDPLHGLSVKEVKERRTSGEGEVKQEQITKKKGQIIRENLFTLFNDYLI